MTALARPAIVATSLILAAFLLHPAARASVWLPGRDLLLSALLLLCIVTLAGRALAIRGPRRLGGLLLAAGLAAAVLGVGLDGVRGVQGTLQLEAGRASQVFEEKRPAGTSLGLRPLGFTLGVESVAASGGVLLRVPMQPAPVELRPGQAVRIGGLRLALVHLRPTAAVSRLRVAMSDGTRTDVVDLLPGQPARVRDLTIALGEYYPDFALDERQQPFNRSLEPRNPAALLDVERDGVQHRAFVLRSMPGVHRVEALGVAFSLLDLDPLQSAEIAVHREPFAPVVLAGAALLGLALALTAWRFLRGPSAQASEPDDLLPGGALLAVSLVMTDSAGVLGWTFAVRSAGERVVLAGVGPLFGIALLAAVGGALTRAASYADGGTSGRFAARLLLHAAVVSGALGCVLAIVRVSVLPQTAVAHWLQIAAVSLPVALLAFVLLRTAGTRAATDVLGPPLPLLALAAVLGAVALAVAGLGRHGSYATSAAVSASAVVLLGLAALEATRLVALRRVAFLAAALALLAQAA
jgi:hypothetical protein